MRADAFNRSRPGTVVVAVITANLALAEAPGNARLSRRESRLSRESVVNVSQVLTLDRRLRREKVRRLPDRVVEGIDAGLRIVLSP